MKVHSLIQLIILLSIHPPKCFTFFVLFYHLYKNNNNNKNLYLFIQNVLTYRVLSFKIIFQHFVACFFPKGKYAIFMDGIVFLKC